MGVGGREPDRAAEQRGGAVERDGVELESTGEIEEVLVVRRAVERGGVRRSGRPGKAVRVVGASQPGEGRRARSIVGSDGQSATGFRAGGLERLGGGGLEGGEVGRRDGLEVRSALDGRPPPLLSAGGEQQQRSERAAAETLSSRRRHRPAEASSRRRGRAVRTSR